MGINVTNMFWIGATGKVIYDEDEDSYKLDRGVLAFDLCQALWQDYEGKKVKVIIQVVDDV